MGDKKDQSFLGVSFHGVPFAFDQVSESTPEFLPPVPIRPNVRTALDYLDEIFCRGGQDAQDLWDIMTALRGPDNSYSDQCRLNKRSVTIPIRRASFPRTLRMFADYQAGNCRNRVDGLSKGVHQRASFGHIYVYDDNADYPYQGLSRADGVAQMTNADHFSVHGCRAAMALGLI